MVLLLQILISFQRLLPITPLVLNFQLLTHHNNIILLLTLLLKHILLLPEPRFLNFMNPSPDSSFFPDIITTKPHSHLSHSYFPKTLCSFIPNPPSSFPSSQNPSLSSPRSLPPPPTSYDSYASFHPDFHNYLPSSFQPPGKQQVADSSAEPLMF